MKQTKQGFLQALGVFLYVALVGLFMSNANRILGKGDNFVTPILVLMLLSFSVLICALIVLYKPYKLFILGKKKEAADVIISTAASLFGFLILLLIGFIVFK